MSRKARKFAFWLHPGDKRQAVCMDRLEMILEQMRQGVKKKGTLSAVIADALFYSFFCDPNRTVGGENEFRLSNEIIGPPAPSQMTALEQPTLNNDSLEIDLKEGDDTDDIVNGLLHLTSRL